MGNFPKVLDGKALSKKILENIKQEVIEILDRDERSPHLAVILVGHDPASMTYVKNKAKKAKRSGLLSSVYEIDEDVSERELLDVITHLNNDEEIDGILVQLPLPKHLNERKILNAINPLKDVDGLHPMNMGRMILGEGFVPCTPKGVMRLLDEYDVDLEGQHVVIVGRSHLVGRPLVQLMLNKNATVSIAHSRTKHLDQLTSQADVLVVAIGQKEFIKWQHVKKGAIVIDVGIHRDKDGLHGDVSQDALEEASMFTPVPGGVGPMTIAMLLENTMLAYRERERLKWN